MTTQDIFVQDSLISTYQIRLRWIDAVIAETIYGDALIPAPWSYYRSSVSRLWPREANAQYIIEIIKDDARIEGIGAATDDYHRQTVSEVPSFFADVPELAEAWRSGWAEGYEVERSWFE